MGEQKRKGVRTTRLKSLMCLNCGANLTAATNFEQYARPQPGSVMICVVCAHIMVYDENLEFRSPTDEEVVEMAGHPEIVKHMKALASYQTTLAVKEEVNNRVEAIIKDGELVMAVILNAPAPVMKYCATFRGTTYAGYGVTPKDARIALLKSITKEIYDDAAARYQQRRRN